MDAPPFILPSPLPQPPPKEKSAPPPAVTPPRASLKRAAPVEENDIIEIEPSAKRVRKNGPAPDVIISSPSKKRKFEEDGLILLDSANDKLDDDVIEID